MKTRTDLSAFQDLEAQKEPPAKSPSHKLKGAVALLASVVLSAGLLTACSASPQGEDASQPAPSPEGYAVTFDAGEATSAYGVQNADNMPYLKEYQAGDTVDIPDIAGGDYDVFIPGYTLTGWMRSDTGEVIPVETQNGSDEGDEASSASSSDGDEEEVAAEGAEVTEETPDGTATADVVEVEESDSSSSSSSSDDSVGEFVMPENDVTLVAQWTPITIDIYAADGENAEPTFVATVDLSGAGIEGSAEDTSAWLSYNTFNEGEARVFTSAFYFPLEAVFDQAGIEVSDSDTVIIGEDVISGEGGDTSTVKHDWSFYENGMFYPNTTCDTYSLDGAEAVTPSLALSYKETRSTSKTEALSALVDRANTEGISEQSAEMCPRALFGVPTSSYDQNENYSGSQHPYNVNQILIIK